VPKPTGVRSRSVLPSLRVSMWRRSVIGTPAGEKKD